MKKEVYTEMEVWKKIPFGHYEVSDTGVVRNSKFNRIMKQQEEGFYFFVTLTSGSTRKRCRVHRLVAEAFIPNPKGLPVVNHKDLNPANNHVSNLEWCTYQYNAEHGLGKPIELVSATCEKLLFPSLTKAAEFLGCLPASIHYYANENVPSPSGYVVRYAGGNM